MSSNGSEAGEMVEQKEYRSDLRARLFLLAQFPTRPPTYEDVFNIQDEIKAFVADEDTPLTVDGLLKMCDERVDALAALNEEAAQSDGAASDSSGLEDHDLLDSDRSGDDMEISDSEPNEEASQEILESEAEDAKAEAPVAEPEDSEQTVSESSEPVEAPMEVDEPEKEETVELEQAEQTEEPEVESEAPEPETETAEPEPVDSAEPGETAEPAESETAEPVEAETAERVETEPAEPALAEPAGAANPPEGLESSATTSVPPAVKSESVTETPEPKLVDQSVSPLTKVGEPPADKPEEEQPKSLAKLMRIETLKQLEAQNAEQMQLSRAALEMRQKNRGLTYEEANPAMLSPPADDTFLTYIVPDRLPEPPQYRRPLAELYYSVKAMPTWKLLPSSHKVLSTDIYKLSLLEGRLAIAYGRIEELRQSGKWSLFQRAKFRPPPREEVHQDFLLDEMRWMSTSFSQGRKYKIAMCKQLADAVLDYWQRGPEACCIKARAPKELPPLTADTVNPADVMPVDKVEEPATLASLIPVETVALPMVVRSGELDEVSRQLLEDLSERPVLQPGRYTNEFDTLSITSVTRFLSAPDYARGWRRIALEKPKVLPPALATAVHDNGRLVLPKSAKLPLFQGAQTAALLDHEVRAPQPPDVRYMNTRNATVWTPGDDQKLLVVAKEHKYNWEIVSAYLSSRPTMGYTSNIERRSPWQCFERWLQLNKGFDVRDLKGRYAEQARIWLETLPKAQTVAKRRLSALGVASDSLPRGHKRLRWSSMFEGIRKSRKKKETSATKPNPNRRQAALESLKNTSTGENYKVRSAAELLQLKYDRDRQMAEAYAKTRATAQQTAAARRAAPGMPVPAPTGPTAPGQLKPGQQGQPGQPGPAGQAGPANPAAPVDAEKARIVAQQKALLAGHAGQPGQRAPPSATPPPTQRPPSAQAQRPQSAGATIGGTTGSPSLEQLKAFGNMPPSIAGLPLPASVAAAAALRAQAHAQAHAQAQVQAHAHAQQQAAAQAQGMPTQAQAQARAAQAQVQAQAQAQQQARSRQNAVQALRNATPEQQQQILAERRRFMQMAAAQRQAQQAQAQTGLPPQSPHSSHGGSPFQSPVMDYASLPQSSPGNPAMLPPQRPLHMAGQGSPIAAPPAPHMAMQQPQRVKMSDYVSKTQFQQLLLQIHRQNPSWTRQQVQMFASQQVSRYIRREQEQERLEAMQNPQG